MIKFSEKLRNLMAPKKQDNTKKAPASAEEKAILREEKRKIKREYSDRLKAAKRRYQSKCRRAKRDYKRTLSEYYERNGIEEPKDPPKRSVLEEIGNSVTHGLGSIFAVIAFVLMMVCSESATEYAGASIYFFGLFVMFTASCLYHAFPHGSVVKRVFRRFDYSCIYLLIGATFAPSLLNVVEESFGITFFVIQWSLIALGITLVAVFGPSRLRFIHIPMYVILGWSALMLMPFLIERSFALAMWILAGGIVYTVGIIPYSLKLKASHFIWHFFVLAGAVVQWIGIYLYIYLC